MELLPSAAVRSPLFFPEFAERLPRQFAQHYITKILIYSYCTKT